MRTKTILATMIVLFLSVTAASAANYGIDNLFLPPSPLLEVTTPVDSGQLQGFYDLTFLGKESAYDNLLVLSGHSEALFSNNKSKPGDIAANIDISSLAFQTAGRELLYPAHTWSNNVHIYQLLQDAMINSVALSSGTFLLGFNDIGSDRDFDDMVIAAKPVPVPAAVWMLGAGLLSVVGMRRKKNI